MRHLAHALTLGLVSLIVSAPSGATTPKQQFQADSKAASARYGEDKKICASETNSSARMQCARDAKAEYDKAMAAAKAQMKAGATAGVSVKASAVSCKQCATVVSVQVTDKQGEGSAVGLIAGGVAGALLGRQLGGGSGKDVATVAGAAGGAYAGKKLEEKMKTSKVWNVLVEYGDGNKHTYTFDKDPGLVAGDHVKNADGSITRQ